jgi:hypothetical protein
MREPKEFVSRSGATPHGDGGEARAPVAADVAAAGGVALRTIRVELARSDCATALGIVVRGSAPVINLCRKLIDAGCDPATPLEAWRGSTLALRIRSIGEAGALT